MSLCHLTSNHVTTVPLETLPVIVMAVDVTDKISVRTAAEGTVRLSFTHYTKLSRIGKHRRKPNTHETKANTIGGLFYQVNLFYCCYLHRATVPASTGVLSVPGDAVPTTDMVYISPLVSPVSLWLLVLPTFTLSLLPPPPM